jgi:hypothetical protein
MKNLICASLFALVATGAPAQTNHAGHFAGSTATISNTLSLAGGDARGSGSLAHGFSLATGRYAIALGFGAAAGHDRTFVWAGGTNQGVASSAPGQFVIYAPGGIHLLGGRIYGDASALVGISASNVIGLGSAAFKSHSIFATANTAVRADNAYSLASLARTTATSAFATANSALQSSGRVSWSGTQNAAGQSLTNLHGAYTFTVTHVTVDVVQSHLTGLDVIDADDSGCPCAGLYTGDLSNGFFGPASITRDKDWNWFFLRETVNSGCEFPGSFTPWNDGGFWVGGWWIGYSMYRDGGPLNEMTVFGGSPFDGIYNYDGGFGYYREDGAVFVGLDGSFSWSLPSTQQSSLGWHGEACGPLGEFTLDLPPDTWPVRIEPRYTEVIVQETRPVTNAVPFEVADGRHAWMGSHNAGGYDLLDVGRLQAGTVVGDGSALFNVGLTAMDLTSVDLRYVCKAGDTVHGDLDVSGTLTSGGRPVATLTHVPPQGDISMGSFTNAPSRP